MERKDVRYLFNSGPGKCKSVTLVAATSRFTSTLSARGTNFFTSEDIFKNFALECPCVSVSSPAKEGVFHGGVVRGKVAYLSFKNYHNGA